MGQQKRKPSRPARSPDSNEGKGLRKFLSAPWWAGLAAIATIIALIISFLLFTNSNNTGPRARSSRGVTSSTVGAAGQVCPGRLPSISYILVFCDNFRQYNWVDYENPSGAYASSNGSGYTVNSTTDGDIETVAPANAPSPFAIQSEHSAGASVIADAVDGQNGEYGLVCQGGPSAQFRAKAYFFALKGERAVIEKLEDRKRFKISNVAESGYLSNLHSTSNLLQASCTANGSAVTLTFWINGKRVVDFADKSHALPGGYIGVFAEKVTQDKAIFTANFQDFGAYSDKS